MRTKSTEASLAKIEKAANELVNVPAFKVGVLPKLKELAANIIAIQEAVNDARLQKQFLSTAAVLAETAQHFGQIALAKSVLETGRAVALEVGNAASKFERFEVTREAVRFTAVFAFVVYHEGGAPTQAQSILNRCIEVIESIRRETFPCYGTSAHSLLHRAIVNRGLGREDLALEDLHKALNLYSIKARSFRIARTTEKRQEPLHWFRHRAIQVLIELGWAYYRQGRLDRSVDCVASADLLQGGGDLWTIDPITDAHISLLRAAAERRSTTGLSEDNLKSAMQSLKLAGQTYAAFGHSHGQARSIYEQGMILRDSEMGQEKDAARALFRRAQSMGEHPTAANKRLSCFAQSQLSRLASDRDEAITLAKLALSDAEDIKSASCQLDARFALAEAHLRLPIDPVAVRQQLAYAKKSEAFQAGTNPRLNLELELLSAWASVRERKFSEADEYLRRARSYIAEVEHGRLRRLLGRVEDERKEGDAAADFRLPAGKQQNYRDCLHALQQWLLEQATSHHKGKNDETVAEAINITRTTLYNWRRQLKKGSIRS